MKNRQRFALVAAMTALLAQVPAAFAIDVSALPPEHTRNGITYMTGGIGQPESTAMREIAGRYDLSITFAKDNGSYLSAVPVQITDSSGMVMLSLTSDPILLVNLPNGTYRVTASVDGILRERTVNIGQRHDRIAYTWPNSVDETSNFAAFETPSVTPPPMAPSPMSPPAHSQPAPTSSNMAPAVKYENEFGGHAMGR